MSKVDSVETLQVLVNAHNVIANAVAQVLSTDKPVAAPRANESADKPKKVNPSPKARQKGPRTNELDERVHALLESRPGTSVAEIEREIADSTISRSRLEWSLRRLLAKGRIVKSGNTCGARYSAARSSTAPSSSLHVVGS